jgi:hypothetical protein
VRSGKYSDVERGEAIAAIRNVLQSSKKPDNVHQDAWDQLQKLITQNNAFADFITRFEWSLGSEDFATIELQIKEGLLHLGFAPSLEAAEYLFDRLFVAVFTVLRTPGLKRLTPQSLQDEIAKGLLAEPDQILVAFVRSSLSQLERRVAALERDLVVSTASVESLREVVSAIATKKDLVANVGFTGLEITLDIPDLVVPAIPRVNAVQKIVELFKHQAAVNLVGEPGSGKTQLSLLIAKALNRQISWIDIPRGFTVHQAAAMVDAAIVSLTHTKRQLLLKPWYEDTAEKLGTSVLIINAIIPINVVRLADVQI